jgi:hypothetical protein
MTAHGDRLYETTGQTDDPPFDPVDHLHDPPADDLVTAFARARLDAGADVEPPPAEDGSAASADDDGRVEEPDPETTLADLCPPLDPLVRDLTAHAAASRPDFPDDPAGVLEAAAERYLARRLSNEPHRTESIDPTLSLAGTGPLVDAVTEAVSAGDGLCVDRAVRAGLRATLSRDAPEVDPAAVPVPRRPMLNTVVDADDTNFESVAGVLSAAVLGALTAADGQRSRASSS